MSYKTRADSADYRGGRVNPEDDAPKPRRRYPCFAEGCPMVGSIFLGAGVGGTGEQRGSCAWHYAVQPNDIPKVTRVLLEWQCVSYEINEARRVLTGELAADALGLGYAYRAACERLVNATSGGGWGDHFAYRAGSDYGSWAKGLEQFLGGKVVEVLSIRRDRRAA